ncbi:MAG: argininosuccinate lyase [Spirosomataceae bacterium]
MKLWQKEAGQVTSSRIETFTVGQDRVLDIHLAPFDILGNMAHAIMLHRIGLLTTEDTQKLLAACREIYSDLPNFTLEEGIEDVHSQVEYMLTQKLGEIGKKIHSGRSRNDQVLVDLKMYMRHEVEQIVGLTSELFDHLIRQSRTYQHVLLPGYTHLQIAMPSSFGLWFGAYAESLVDDVQFLQGAYQIINKNPLGSGAGYGSSFPLDRRLTTELLGFDDLHYNVVYAQMSRGKTETLLLQAISSLAQTISRLAMDVCVYNSQNFGFVDLPSEMTTGSSIMPHKKNPDVAEILRGKTNRLKAMPIEIQMIMANLPSGYHRDMQLIKEILIPAIHEMKECLSMSSFLIEHMKVRTELLDDPKYDVIFSVENVNQRVMEGVPFRDAYKEIGLAIEAGQFKPIRDLKHTLLGSLGNPAQNEIEKTWEKTKRAFHFEKVHVAYDALLTYQID